MTFPCLFREAVITHEHVGTTRNLVDNSGTQPGDGVRSGVLHPSIVSDSASHNASQRRRRALWTFAMGIFYV